MFIFCIHGRQVADSMARPCDGPECLDCAELEALHRVETTVRAFFSRDAGRGDLYVAIRRDLVALDDIRRRKGPGAVNHPDTNPAPAPTEPTLPELASEDP